VDYHIGYNCTTSLPAVAAHVPVTQVTARDPDTSECWHMYYLHFVTLRSHRSRDRSEAKRAPSRALLSLSIDCHLVTRVRRDAPRSRLPRGIAPARESPRIVTANGRKSRDEARQRVREIVDPRAFAPTTGGRNKAWKRRSSSMTKSFEFGAAALFRLSWPVGTNESIEIRPMIATDHRADSSVFRFP